MFIHSSSQRFSGLEWGSFRYASGVEETQSLPCAKKVRLFHEFHETTLAYSKVVEAALAYSTVVCDLAEMADRIEQEEYRRIDGAIDKVCREYEKSRDHLTRQIAEHGC
jgi:hypothetical protein